MKRKLVGMLLASVMVLSLAACGSSDTEETSGAEAEETVGEETGEAAEADDAGTEEADAAESAGALNATVIWRAFDDQFQSGFRIIMQNVADGMDGVTLDMQDAANDVSTANNRLDAALTKGTDVLAICAPDRESTETMAEKADAENVPVVFFNMEPMESTMEAYDNIYYVGAEAAESGAMCAQALINYWNENTEIADKNGDGVLQLCILQGEIGQQDTSLRTQAYEDTLQANGIEYEILASDTADWDQATALDKMTAWISAYGIDGIEGVLCNNDSMAMGAVQACINEGCNQGDAEKFVPIVGIDANIDALEAMKSGSLLGTVLNDRQNQSTAIINVMKAVNEGQEITEDVVGVDCTVNGKYIWVPYVIVDESNLDETLELMNSIS